MTVKRRIEGVGMLQREVLSRPASNDEIRAALEKAFKGPEQRWRETEAWCLEILRRSGTSESDHYFARRFPEDTVQYLAREWLLAWHRAQGARERGDFVVAMMFAEGMGVLRERMFWRQGIDPETGKRPEELALRERAAAGNRRAGGATNAAAAEARRAIAHRLAAEIQAKRSHLMSGRALAEKVREAWPDDEDRPSSGAVRNYLRNFLAKV
jgi:hypothetical protein